MCYLRLYDMQQSQNYPMYGGDDEEDEDGEDEDEDDDANFSYILLVVIYLSW